MARPSSVTDGMEFGRLTTIAQAGRDSIGNIVWLCLCKCGGWAKVPSANLKRGGNTSSCGCYRRERMEKLGRRSKGKRRGSITGPVEA